ncbi:MAG: hypothetical protein QF886_26000 [Planctomycetota bacterium]|nr:hypothetical protein [Planctomycetota bacterium]
MFRKLIRLSNIQFKALSIRIGLLAKYNLRPSVPSETQAAISKHMSALGGLRPSIVRNQSDSEEKFGGVIPGDGTD